MRFHQNHSLAIACLTLACIPLAAFVVRPAAPPISQHATITFHVHTATPVGTASGLLNQTTKVVLAVSKPGRTALVAGKPGAGQVDGVHSFAIGSTAGAISKHYADLLTGSGWVPGVDFLHAENSIHFYGIHGVTLDCDHRQLYAGLSVDQR